jgi:peptidoglycan/LPS O-acetylase OafA/YrhL
MKRYDTLDAMRGVAAFLIIVRHTPAFWGGLAFQHSYLAVDFFFLLSGFVVGHAYEHKLRTDLSLVQFMKLRLIRLYPLYAIGFALSLVCLLLRFYTLPYSGWKLAGVVAGAGLLLPYPGHDQIFPLNGPAWSLSCELLGNLAYAAGLRYLTNRRLMAVVAGCGLTVAIAACLSHRGGLDGGFTLKTLPLAFARFGFAFGLGVLLYRKRSAGAERRQTRLDMVLPPLFILFAVLALPDLNRLWASLYAVVCIVFVFPALLWLGADYEPPAWLLPLFRGLGTSSYPVYILQVPAAVLVTGVLNVAGYPPSGFAPWSGIAFMAFLTALAFVLVRHVEQPVRQRLRRVAQITHAHVRRRFSRSAA